MVSRLASFEVVKAPVEQKKSRMPQQSQLLLKALCGLRKGMMIQFKCESYDDAYRTSKALWRFIYDRKKSGKLNGKFSVLRREGGDNSYWFVFVVKKSQVR